MLKLINKGIYYSYFLLFFLVPLVLHPATSELFEFNKMVLTYLLTIFIACLWLIKSVLLKKIVFKKTRLLPFILIFLAGQLLSTIFSIDFRTSFLGYYSRFHGGLMSTICYIVLYLGFVSNLDNNSKDSLIKKSIFPSAVLVSFYGILERMGIDKKIWVQDVQSRVFSTLGQPNWLAAWLDALIPITWSYAITFDSDQNRKSAIGFNNIIWFLISVMLFTTLLFTNSRSGLLGFAVADFGFWVILFIRFLREHRVSRNMVLTAASLNIIFVILAFTFGSQYTPKFSVLFNRNVSQPAPQVQTQGPALEVGGSSSGEIRKIVWKGAIDIWKNYPVFGSGLETFAFAYYKFRPAEHNLVSEWDYLYNKAHNEYLNIAATSGTFGILSYLALIVFSLYEILRGFGGKTDGTRSDYLKLGLFTGYLSILVTNFFGFSVVPVAVLFFMYPALAIDLDHKDSGKEYTGSPDTAQKIYIGSILTVSCYLIFATLRYWNADLNFSKGKAYGEIGDLIRSQDYLMNAIKLSPSESVYWDELSKTNADIALALNERENKPDSDIAIKASISDSQTAISLSPANVNLKRTYASNLLKLHSIDKKYLENARQVLETAITAAPTDAKFYYNLGLTYLRMDRVEEAEKIFSKTIQLKANYKNPHIAMGFIYIDKGEKEKAKEEFQYILKYIDPNDEQVKAELKDLGV